MSLLQLAIAATAESGNRSPRLNALLLKLAACTACGPGPAGPTGPTGATGAAGAAGATGATGATGSSGGVAAFGIAESASDQVIAVNGLVAFSLGGTPFPFVGITPPAPGGTAFTIIATGVYQISYHVRGTPGVLTPPNALAFDVFQNGTIPGPPFPAAPANRYAADSQTTSLPAAPDGTQQVNGEIIISLTAGDTISLHNSTGSNTDTVTLTSAIQGGAAAVNARLTILRLA